MFGVLHWKNKVFFLTIIYTPFFPSSIIPSFCSSGDVGADQKQSTLDSTRTFFIFCLGQITPIDLVPN